MKKALFFKKEDSLLRCLLCRHNCKIEEGGVGICKVRKNIEGELFSLNYGKLVAKNIDPIEKKPFYHFFPASRAYSIASWGCNFRCPFCQNWEISQTEEFKRWGGGYFQADPLTIVNLAKSSGCKSISYTYTEPTVFFEFALEVAELAKKEGLYNNFVTNGYISREALKEISPFLDACNVDLKSFREDFYSGLCGAKLKGVLDSIEYMKELGIWVELTTLIISGYNDTRQELKDLCKWIVKLDKNIPWHISRFYPHYKFKDIEPTPLETLEQAYKIAKEEGLSYVYIGNIYTSYGENTYCPECGQLLIEREGFYVLRNNLKEGFCPNCQNNIEGVF